MSDVRALLRQQREARRITHPHALYSDAGKLLCALCREPIRAETHWDAHLKSASHRQNLACATAMATSTGSQKRKLDADRDRSKDDGSQDHALQGRRRGEDGAGADREQEEEEEEEEEQAARRKRTKPDPSLSSGATTPGGANGERKNSQTPTPTPSLARRPSTTLSQGVEIQIPSRSTPPNLRREEQSTASPSSASLTPQQAGGSAATGTDTPLPSRHASGGITPVAELHQPPPTSTTPIPNAAVPTPPPPSSALSAPGGPIDESEWAAFEADIAAASYASDATISRPAMTAEQSAAAKQAQDDAAAAAAAAASSTTSRKAKADADIEDEREEATRALEEEFDEMQELEARVRRLKEKRETLLRRREMSSSALLGVGKPVVTVQGDEEYKATPSASSEEAMRDDDDDDDDDEDEDEWDIFRFRKG